MAKKPDRVLGMLEQLARSAVPALPPSARIFEDVDATMVTVLKPGLLRIETEDGPRVLQGRHIESVSPHGRGCIVKTASGDFHLVEGVGVDEFSTHLRKALFVPDSHKRTDYDY